MASLVISINDFQSIQQAKLELDPGITLITGPNSSGKTAILRAIRALLQNPQGGQRYVRSGALKAVVALKVDGHEPVAWVRAGSNTTYKVGEQIHVKPGRAGALELAPTLPFLVDDKRLINLHSEHDVLFPFDHTPTELFRLFEALFKISDSSKIIDLMKADESKLRTRIKEDQAVAELNNRKVSSISDYLAGFDKEKTEKLKTLVEKTEKELAVLESDLFKVEASDSVSGIDLPQSHDYTSKLNSIFVSLAEFQEAIKSLNTIDILLTVPLPEIHEYPIILDSYQPLSDAYQQVCEQDKKIGQLELEIQHLDLEVTSTNEALGQFSQCPLCGNSLKEAHSHD